MTITQVTYPPDRVITTRGEVIESTHQVHAAIVDDNGRLLYAVGNPTRVTLARSAAKLMQALAVLETGGPDSFGFDTADLALMCASHSSEERHVSRARNMLSKVGAEESNLRCGGHVPISADVNREWIKKDFTPGPVCNNCSGKHAGMLSGSKALGADWKNYHLPEHPVQVRVKRTVEELSGLDEEQVKWSVDGCNLPTPAMPLANLGGIYARCAAAMDTVEAEDRDGLDSEVDGRKRYLGRIFHAMSNYPELVGGEGRFCTILMKAWQGGLIGKLGADGCYAIGVRASEQTRRLGAAGAIGIAIKIEDGNVAILYSAAAEILEQLQIGTEKMRKELEVFRYPEKKNTVGVVTGRVIHTTEVRKAVHYTH